MSVLRVIVGVLIPSFGVAEMLAQQSTPENLAPLPGLAEGIRSRYVDNHNGLRMHILEAGYGATGRPTIVLLHGFPELAYSWRKVMPPLAAAGYHVVAPDQRGFGRTTGADTAYDTDLAPFRMVNRVRDVLGLVSALGLKAVHISGHDAGSPVAAWCALIRPDVFRSVILMTSPFGGPPVIPFATGNGKPVARAPTNSVAAINRELAKLPRPRKHYQWYYTTREANGDMLNARQGLHAFMRGYYHQKSGDWSGNKPFPLQGWTAEELAKMPTYYIMDLARGMAETVAEEMPTPVAIAACRWLPDTELAVYTTEYQRTGFQGGLQWYRANVGGKFNPDLEMYSGRTIDVPACYIAGELDWGNYQFPGALEKMQKVCTRMTGVHLVQRAGHWVQQEQPEEVANLMVEFLAHADKRRE